MLTMLSHWDLLYLFEWLRLRDLKKARLVCREWNSAASRLLGRRVIYMGPHVPFWVRHMRYLDSNPRHTVEVAPRELLLRPTWYNSIKLLEAIAADAVARSALQSVVLHGARFQNAKVRWPHLHKLPLHSLTISDVNYVAPIMAKLPMTLQSLTLISNNVSDGHMAALATLPHLRELHISSIQLRVPLALHTLSELRILTLHGTTILSLQGLRRLHKLEQLALSHISDIVGTSDVCLLTNLSRLTIKSCYHEHSDLDGLYKLRQIRYLDLSRNKSVGVYTLGIVSKLPLHTLILSGCDLMDLVDLTFSLDSIHNMPRLLHLYVDDTGIDDEILERLGIASMRLLSLNLQFARITEWTMTRLQADTLQFLNIIGCVPVYWRKGVWHMPKLRRLAVSYWPGLHRAIQHMPQLEEYTPLAGITIEELPNIVEHLNTCYDELLEYDLGYDLQTLGL